MINTAHNHRPFWTGLALLATLCTLVGCQTFGDNSPGNKESKWLPTKKEDPLEVARNRPTKLVAIWSEMVVYGANNQPTRGLGGRIYFYNQRHQTVPAKGELIVYAFDDKSQADQAKRKFVFTPEQFSQRYSVSDFGPSYSVWVPWDRVGGKQQSISVVPVFKTTEGQLLMGDHARNLLNGKKSKQERLVKEETVEKLRRVAYETRTVGRDDQGDLVRNRIRTSTIEVPPSMRQRVLAAENLSVNRKYQNSSIADRMEKLRQTRMRQPQAHLLPSKSQVRAEQVGQPIRGRPRSQPRHANGQSDLPHQPQWDPAWQSTSNSSTSAFSSESRKSATWGNENRYSAGFSR